jgi:hypothetical protein
MPILGLTWYLNKTSKSRWVYGALIILATILLNETGSRLSWLVFGMIVAMWLFTRNAGLRVIALLILLSAVVMTLAGPEEVSALLGLDSSSASLLTGNASIQVRWNLFLNGLAFTGETALIGLGPGGFEIRMMSAAKYDTAGIQSTHSGVIEVLAQYGVVVFLAVACLLIWLTVEGAKGIRGSVRRSELRELSVALVIGTVALTPLSFTNSSTLDLSFTWTYLLMLCLVGVEVSRRRREAADEGLPAGSSR